MRTMEDFVAGFEETADRYRSAADWVRQYRDAGLVPDWDGEMSRRLEPSIVRRTQSDGGRSLPGRGAHG